MKNAASLSILILILFFTGSCTLLKRTGRPEHITIPLSDTVGLRDGTVVYALPMTVFTVKVEAIRTIELPGPYARYAEELLGLKGIIRNESEQWLLKSVSVTSHEEADPSEYYVIEGKSMLQTNVLALRREGLIMDINPAMNYQIESFVDNKEVKVNQLRSFDLGSDEYYQIQIDTAFRRITMDSTFIRVPYIVEKKKLLSEDQLAERTAHRLMELRDGKFMILTGEANVFPQNEAAINEINRMEKEYTDLFTGKTLSETKNFVYQYIPQKDISSKPATLFIFSETTGPGETNLKKGIPVTIKLVPEQRTKDLTILVKDHAKKSATVLDKLYYRIPDIVSLTIDFGDKTIYRSRKLVSQYGEVMQMPSNYIIGK